MAVASTVAFSRMSPSCFCFRDAYILLGYLHICPTVLARTHLMLYVLGEEGTRGSRWGLLALGRHSCLSISWQVKKTSLNLCSCAVSLVTEAQFERFGEGSTL